MSDGKRVFTILKRMSDSIEFFAKKEKEKVGGGGGGGGEGMESREQVVRIDQRRVFQVEYGTFCLDLSH